MKGKAPVICRRDDQTKRRDVGRFAKEDVRRSAGAQPPSTILFGGAGEMGGRILDFDWSKTPLGPLSRWPQSLTTCVQIMLASRQPIWLGWGPELTYFYNDPFIAIVGGRHPLALGKPMREVWPEVWDEIESSLQRALGGTEGLYVEQRLFIMERHGFREETYYTYSLTPIPNGDDVGGIICFNTDDTLRVIRQRRISLLQELAAVKNARSIEEVCERVKSALATNPKDLPFVLIYMLDASGERVVLKCPVGFPPGHPAAPATLNLSDDSPWPVGQVLQSNTYRVVDLAHFSDLPAGFWTKSPDKAVVLPLNAGAEGGERAGVVIVGLNPFRQFNERYQSFLSLVVSQIATARITGLEHEVARETFERQQEALRNAETMIHTKDRFLAMVSHELRTPLNPVLLVASDAATDPDLPPAIRGQFDVILKNVEVQVQIIDDLLDLSRITHGKINLRMRPVDAHGVLEQALQTIQSQIQNKQIQIAERFYAEQHFISADPVRLQQIFCNILSNAVKFTPQQGKISIETFVTGDKNSEKFGVKITDTGIGMTAEEMNRIFSAFAQGDHTLRGSVDYGGLGLGLAISNRLVELHSGSIRAVSEGRGRGSAFTVEFPLAKG